MIGKWEPTSTTQKETASCLTSFHVLCTAAGVPEGAEVSVVLSDWAAELESEERGREEGGMVRETLRRTMGRERTGERGTVFSRTIRQEKETVTLTFNECIYNYDKYNSIVALRTSV